MYHNVVLLGLIVLASYTLGRPGPDEFEGHMGKCMHESGMDAASFKTIPWDDHKMKCFGACVMKEHGHMNADGTVNTEKAIGFLPPDLPNHDMVVEALKECGTKKNEDDCETAHEIWMCLKEKNALPPMHGPPKPF